MDRYTLLIDNAMISDKKGDWVHYKDAAARISELEAQLADARKELLSVLEDWNDAVRASGSKSNGGFIGHITNMRKQLVDAQERERWIPVTERLPRQLDVVDVQIRHGYQTDVMQNDGGDHWIDGEGNCWEAGTVTHWRYRRPCMPGT